MTTEVARPRGGPVMPPPKTTPPRPVANPVITRGAYKKGGKVTKRGKMRKAKR